MEEKFKLMDHMADIKFQVQGRTINEIFENSVLALVSYLADEKVSPKKAKIISVSGQDTESLLYKFLEELIYLVDAEHFITCKAEVKVNGFNLKAELFGDETGNYRIKQIKAATYAEMYIKKVKSKSESGFEAQFVLDV